MAMTPKGSCACVIVVFFIFLVLSMCIRVCVFFLIIFSVCVFMRVCVALVFLPCVSLVVCVFSSSFSSACVFLLEVCTEVYMEMSIGGLP